MQSMPSRLLGLSKATSNVQKELNVEKLLIGQCYNATNFRYVRTSVEVVELGEVMVQLASGI